MAESYPLAKVLTHRFERGRFKVKNSVNINGISQLANKDNSDIYRKLIIGNSYNYKTLWLEVRNVLNQASEAILPLHKSKSYRLIVLCPFL